jgi:hypothetical protein
MEREEIIESMDIDQEINDKAEQRKQETLASYRAESMTEKERRKVYLCILDALPPEFDNEPAGPLMRMLWAMTDEQLVAFHEQMRKGKPKEKK